MPIAKKEKKTKTKEKRYSYNEYRRAFGVKSESGMDYSTVSPEVFGVRLAQEALKKVKQDLQRK